MLLKIFNAPVPLYTSAGSLVILAPNLSFPSLPPPEVFYLPSIKLLIKREIQKHVRIYSRWGRKNCDEQKRGDETQPN